jgi:probable rRNA maturation factor
MPLRLTLQTGRFTRLPTRRTLRRWIAAALDRDDTAAPNATLTLRFVGAREGRQLNRTFRGKDHATNVLTFDYARRPVVIADIVLCVPVIEREARAQGKTLRAHLAHLVIHGVLHAQGHDHDRPAPARRMETREIELLAALRIRDPYAET